MAKKTSKDDPVDRARRKLAKAQMAYAIAQSKRSEAILQGERELREAQERAARRELQATKLVERRASDVSQAEIEVRALEQRAKESDSSAATVSSHS
jgi:hypothetical protein